MTGGPRQLVSGTCQGWHGTKPKPPDSPVQTFPLLTIVPIEILLYYEVFLLVAVVNAFLPTRQTP